MLISFDFYDFSIFYSFVFGATNFEFRSPIWRCFVGSVLRASHMKNSVCSHFALYQCELNETATKRRGSTGNPGRNRARSPELPCFDHSQTPSPLANETHQRDRPNWRTKRQRNGAHRKYVIDPVKIGERNPPLARGDDPDRNGERNGHERNGNETEHIEVRCGPVKIGERNPAHVPTGYGSGSAGHRRPG